ncbi:MAG: hypothetical protein IPG10_19005 [Flavobacteriales bacterium]|nr:hypothetical protein [Flavobacteriales bacterium]
MRFLQLTADFSAAILTKCEGPAPITHASTPGNNMNLELLKSSLAKAFEQYVVGIINGLPGRSAAR